MASVSELNNPVTDDDHGFAPMIVRLNDPFDAIVANNPDLKIEQTADGEIVFMSPTGGETGRKNSEIAFQLVQWARSAGGVAFDSSTLFRLPGGGLRSPDASWISDLRWNSLTKVEQAGYPPIAPDFVIELRSHSDRISYLQNKMNEYITCGVRLGWLVDPLQAQVHLFQPHETPLILSNPSIVSGDPILPGFVLDLTRIF